MRTDNPTRVILMVALAAILTALFSCTKQETEDVEPITPPPTFTLSFHGSGINLDAIPATQTIRAVSGATNIGWCAIWDADSLKMRVFILGDTLPTYSSGEIFKNGFLLNLDSSTMNVCNAGQNTQIHYEIKENGHPIH